MPAWTPDVEGTIPFDDEDELKSDLPSELSAFLQRFDIKSQFTIDIKLWKNEAYTGRPVLLGRMEGMVPNYDSVVAVNGPGFYGFDTTWTPKGGKPRNEMLKVALVGPQWTEIHKKAKKEKEKAELEEAEHEANLARIRNGVSTAPLNTKGPAEAGREYMKSMLGDMKDLAETFGLGGMTKAPQGGDMMPMMFMGMMQMMMKAQENSTNLLIAVMGQQNKGDSMKESIGLFREMLSIKDGLMPRETHWIESVVSAISDNLGPIAGLFMRGNPTDDPLHQKMNEGLAETREKAQEDPNFLKGLVKHMDAKVGPNMTDKILKGFLNINRPPPKAPAQGQGSPREEAQGPEGGNAGQEAGE